MYLLEFFLRKSIRVGVPILFWLAAVRDRVATEYRHEAGEQYTPMLRDLRTVLGQLNVITEFWQSAEKELDEMQSRVIAAIEAQADEWDGEDTENVQRAKRDLCCEIVRRIKEME